MAEGYWSKSWWRSCRDCKSGPKAKFCCEICGHVCKAPWEGSPVCPGCQLPMVCMGDKWRPLKKKHWKVNAEAARNHHAYMKRLREALRPNQ